MVTHLLITLMVSRSKTMEQVAWSMELMTIRASSKKYFKFSTERRSSLIKKTFFSRTPGSRQPSPGEESLARNTNLLDTSSMHVGSGFAQHPALQHMMNQNHDLQGQHLNSFHPHHPMNQLNQMNQMNQMGQLGGMNQMQGQLMNGQQMMQPQVRTISSFC